MTRNVMDRLAAVRPADLDTEPDASRREHDLNHAMAHPPQTRRHARPRTTRRVTIGVAVTATAAAATAVAVVGTDGRERGHRPGHQRTAPVALDAHTVLLAAADRAYRQPGGTGAYWHMETLDRAYLRAGSGNTGYTLISRTRTETWTPNTVGKEQWNRVQPLGAVPATPEDRAAWQRAGSPKTITVRVPVAPGSTVMKQMTVSTRPGKVYTGHQPLVGGDMAYWLGRNVTMKEARTLPDTPDGLRSWLLRSYTGHDSEAVGRPMTSDAWLFQVTSGLITQAPVTARVRAAAFRVLAALPSVRTLGTRTDSQGRTGVALTLPMPDAVSGHQLVIDPATGQALADETVVVHPSGSAAGYAVGAPLTSSTVLTQDWTDTTPATR